MSKVLLSHTLVKYLLTVPPLHHYAFTTQIIFFLIFMQLTSLIFIKFLDESNSISFF